MLRKKLQNFYSNFNEEINMSDYVCPVCGYVRKPAELELEYQAGDNVKIDELPEGWSCPTCGINRGELEEMS
jgi:rubredoxin